MDHLTKVQVFLDRVFHRIKAETNESFNPVVDDEAHELASRFPASSFGNNKNKP
jgi:hypothetical protein